MDEKTTIQALLLAKRLGIGDNVDSVGAVPQDNSLEQEFSAAQVAVLTRVAEAFGTVPWQAMACGLPMLSKATACWCASKTLESSEKP